MADSDSSLSSAPPTDDEMDLGIPQATAPEPAAQKKRKKKNGTILTFFKHRSPSPPPRKRDPSPPHEPVPEDNPDIAVCIGRVHRVPTRRVASQSRPTFSSTPPPADARRRSSSSCSGRASTKHSRAAPPMSALRISSQVSRATRRRPTSRACCAPCLALSSIARSLSSESSPCTLSQPIIPSRPPVPHTTTWPAC